MSGINDLDGLRDALRRKDELRTKQKAIALTLLEQCKGEGMTVADVVAICEIATTKAKATTQIYAEVSPEAVRLEHYKYVS